MPGQRSANCEYAIRLVNEGKTLTEAALRANVHYTTIWRAIYGGKKKPKKSTKDSA